MKPAIPTHTRSKHSNLHSFDEWNQEITVLMSRIQQHESQALKDLHNLAANKLLGIILRIVNNQHDAEDVLQDVMVKLWKKSSSYSGRGSAWGWLCVFTRHAALDFLRSNQRHAHEQEGEQALEQMAEQAIEQPIEQWDISDQHSIKRCLQTLTTQKRQSILLAYLYGYSHHEIASKMSSPLGTIKAWVRRGLQELKSCLTR